MRVRLSFKKQFEICLGILRMLRNFTYALQFYVCCAILQFNISGFVKVSNPSKHMVGSFGLQCQVG